MLRVGIAFLNHRFTQNTVATDALYRLAYLISCIIQRNVNAITAASLGKTAALCGYYGNARKERLDNRNTKPLKYRRITKHLR